MKPFLLRLLTIFYIFILSSCFNGRIALQNLEDSVDRYLIHKEANNIDSAIFYLLEVKKYFDLFDETNFEEYSTILNNLGYLYNSMGDHAAALHMYQKSLEINKSLLGEQHPDYATDLCNLASLYESMGDYASALPMYQKAIEITKSVLGEQHPDYAINLNNLAGLYVSMGDYATALPMYQKAIEITKSIYGEQHPDYATNLNNLAGLYVSMGDYATALPMFQKALEIKKTVLGEQHYGYAVGLNNLASLYESMGDYAAALPMYQKALEIVRSAYGEEHFGYSEVLENLGVVYESMGEVQLAASYRIIALDINLKLTKKSAGFLSEQQQKKYWQGFNSSLEAIQSFCLRSDEVANISSRIFNNFLESKGSLLNSKKLLLSAASTSQDVIVQDVYQDFMFTIRLLFAEENLPINVRHFNTDSLREVVQQLEEQLTRLGSEKLNIQFEKPATWEEIAITLESNEVAVVFSHFNYYEKQGWTDSVMYVAYVITSGCLAPAFVPLFEEKELTTLLGLAGGDANAIYSYGEDESYGDDLWKMIWGQLDTFLVGAQHVYFSTTGLLNGLNLAALPNGLDERQVPMLVDYNMHQLMNLGTLLEDNTGSDRYLNGVITAFGGLNYEIGDDEWRDGIPDHTIATRGIEFYSSDTTRSGYKFLPYTLKEVEAIVDIAKEHNAQVQLYTGNEGLEEQYRQLAGKASPQVLHLATHATFLEDIQEEKEFLVTDRFQYNANNDPMYRSRLMLSGANRSLKGGQLPAGVLDGILTANDVSTIMLPNTELVVLSACQTGVGVYDASEGVYGLQRAFKMVGVDNLLMTLYEVDDAATAIFMITYYENLFQGMTYYEAFRATQLKMINSQYGAPSNWAGMVLLQ